MRPAPETTTEVESTPSTATPQHQRQRKKTRRPNPYRQLGIERLDSREMLDAMQLVDPTLTSPSQSEAAFENLTQSIVPLQETIAALPAEEQLTNDLQSVRSQLAALDAEQATLLAHPVLPIDAPQWSTVGAPTGSLGKIRFDAVGNDYAVKQSKDGRLLLISSQESVVKLVDAKTGATLPLSFGGHTKLVIDATFSPDGKYVATASYDGNARVFDVSTGALVTAIPFPSSLVTTVTFSPSGRYLVIGRCERTGTLIDTQTWQTVQSLPGMFTVSPGFSPDESTLSYLDDGTIRTVNLSTGTSRGFKGNVGSMYAYAASSDGTLGVGGAADGRLTVYRLSDGTKLAQTASGGPVLSVALSQNGELIAGWPGRIAIYDASTVATSGSIPLLKEYAVPGVPLSITVSGSGRTFTVNMNRDHPQDSDIVVYPLPKAGAAPLRSLADIQATRSPLQAREASLLAQQTGQAQTMEQISTLEEQRASVASAAREQEADATDAVAASTAAVQPVIEDPSIIHASVTVLRTDGPNVTVGISSPAATSVVTLEGAGFLSQDTVSAEGGTHFTAVTLTIDPTKPAGTYPLSLRNRSGLTLAAVSLTWDPVAGTLSAPEAPPLAARMVSAQALSAMNVDGAMAALENDASTILAAEEAISQQIIASRDLSQAVLSSGALDNPAGKAIVGAQRGELVALASRAGHDFTLSGEKLWIRFLDASPEWQDVNRAETMRRMRFSESYFRYARGAEYESYRRYLGAFDDAVGRMMEAGMDAVLAARRAQDPTPALRTLSSIPGDAIYGTAFDWMNRIGVRLPSNEEILDACRDLLGVHADDVAQSHRDARGRIAAAIQQMDSPTYAGTGASTPPTVDTRIQASRALFLANLQAAQRQLPMFASDGVTVVGMGGEPFRANETPDTRAADNSENLRTLLASNGQTLDMVVRGANEQHALGVIHERTTPERVSPIRNGSATITFTLDTASMVNFWVDTGDIAAQRSVLSLGHLVPDVSLALAGNRLDKPHVSDKEDFPGAGETVSSVLPPGTYTLVIQDRTRYSPGTRINEQEHLSPFDVGVNIKPYSTQRIEGRVSIESRDETMPVRMSVAEFTEVSPGTWERKEAQDIQTLNRNKPVWVVVHGRSVNDGQTYEDETPDDSMNLLARSAYEFASMSGGQVVTVDWHEAAKDNPLLLGQLQDATWTMRIGQWVADQLVAAGIPAANVNFIGHSHGTYVSYFAAKQFIDSDRGTVHAIVALDPAANVGFLNGSGAIDASSIKFSAVADTSLSIKASINNSFMLPGGAHPNLFFSQSIVDDVSEYGSDTRAVTAHHAYNLVVPRQLFRDNVHNFPVTAFASILHDAAHGSMEDVAGSPLNPATLLNLHEGPTCETRGTYEGLVLGTLSTVDHSDGSDWPQALPLEVDMADGSMLYFADRLLNY